jgi:molybdopterin converting factor small subunit
MRIKVLFHGILADWVGTQEAEFALREGSPIAELTNVIHRRYGHNMPEQLWDKNTNSFVKSVWAMRGDQKIQDPNEKLKEGDVIKFLLMQAGG